MGKFEVYGNGGHRLAASLPSKEQSIFKRMMMLFENKQFKKAQKLADSILKKYPDHGETLSMKSLTLSHLGGVESRPTAFELAKRGLKNDFRSYLCWHILGLLYKLDKDYKEAIKCFSQASKLFSQNMMILRDLSGLQIHERMYEGFRDSRAKMLSHQPKYLRDWTALALANHLCEDYEMAVAILSEVEEQFKDAPEMEPLVKSEFFLYKATILEECQQYQFCYDYLLRNNTVVLDKIGYLEMLGRIAIYLDNLTKAKETYEELISINQEHEGYILCLLCCQEDPVINRMFIPPHPFKQPIAADPSSSHNVFLHSNCVNFTGNSKFGWFRNPSTSIANMRDRYFLELNEAYDAANCIKRKHYQPNELFLLSGIPNEEQQQHILSFFDEWIERYPKSEALKRLCLFFLNGSFFKHRLDMYLRRKIRNEIPSVFAILRRLCTKAKTTVITDLLESYVCHLNAVPSLFSSETAEALNGHRELEEESPVCLLFALKLLAQHYDFMGATRLALDTIDKAIAHSPTYVDLYVVKGKIMKHAANYTLAAHFYEVARRLDLADRFLNTKATKCLLRMNSIEEAIQVASLFSHQHESEEFVNRIQNIWYDFALAESYHRQKDYGEALRQFHVVLNHFHDMKEDQMDLHLHCILKAMYRAYVRFLRMEDGLFSYRYYRTSAKRIIRINLKLFDGTIPRLPMDSKEEAGGDAAVALEARKRAKPKANKAAEPKAIVSKAGATPLTGNHYLLIKDPLGEATRVLSTLQPCCPFDASVYRLQFEIAIRKGKVLLALQALMRIWRLRKSVLLDKKVLPLLCRFAYSVQIEPLMDIVKSAVYACMGALLIGYYDGVKPLTSLQLQAICDDVLDAFIRMATENMQQTGLIIAAIAAMEGSHKSIDADFILIKHLLQATETAIPTLREAEKLLLCFKGYETLTDVVPQYEEILRSYYPWATFA